MSLTPSIPADWELRFRAARVSLPEWALDAPDRCLYVSNTTGTFELYAWDRAPVRHSGQRWLLCLQTWA